MSAARGEAFAKINLGLAVGPLRPDGKHEVATVLIRIDMHDTIEVEATPSPGVAVAGFEDTIVHDALGEFVRETGQANGWQATIEKRIPVASGLGGGSSDAGTALRLANELSSPPLTPGALRTLAARVGSDVPFFLEDGPMLATGDGTELEPVSLPLDFWVVLVLPAGVVKAGTGAVYEAFDDRNGAEGFGGRRSSLEHALGQVTRAADLAALPRNDLALSPAAGELIELGAFRADVTGAGPAVYALFGDRGTAELAAAELATRGKTWVVRPVAGGGSAP
jgi:4-diphosphocytidyl-2-C-methyl-D-erythritol kinase